MAKKYSVIEISAEETTSSEVIINGVPDLETDMYLRVKDGYHGRIVLNNVTLQGKKHGACIDIGNECDISLVLKGENSCVNGGIRVPVDSKLTVDGYGMLSIELDSANYFGIGNDMETEHGELTFVQSGAIEIKGSGMKGVGIGSGLGGKVNIQGGKYVIRLIGQEGVGIGSYTGDAEPDVRTCDMKIITSTAKAVGVGSMEGNAQIRLESLSWIGEFNTDNVVALGTLDGKKSEVGISCANVMIDLHAQKTCGIGAYDGDVSITVIDSAAVITGRGSNAIAWGSQQGKAKVTIRGSKLESRLETDLLSDMGAEEHDIYIASGECIYMVNGEKQVRRAD